MNSEEGNRFTWKMDDIKIISMKAKPVCEFGVLSLLRMKGFTDNSRCKFIRHQDKRFDVNELIRNGYFEAYQSIQSRPIYDDLDHVIVFVGDVGTTACFYGVYSVSGAKQKIVKGMLPDACPFKEWEDTDNFCYKLVRDCRFDVFRGRVIIEWGSATLSWHQHAKNDKEILEIRRPGKLLAPFDDYLEFTLSYSELTHLFNHPEAHRDWYSRLSAVAGVYLILDSSTGNQYVGSAYGAQGIWGRWSEYAKSGHGGNVGLKNLLAERNDYVENFSFSVLQILPRSSSPEKVIRLESLYKSKLGSRATGLNYPEIKK